MGFLGFDQKSSTSTSSNLTSTTNKSITDAYNQSSSIVNQNTDNRKIDKRAWNTTISGGGGADTGSILAGIAAMTGGESSTSETDATTGLPKNLLLYGSIALVALAGLFLFLKRRGK